MDNEEIDFERLRTKERESWELRNQIRKVGNDTIMAYCDRRLFELFGSSIFVNDDRLNKN